MGTPPNVVHYRLFVSIHINGQSEPVRVASFYFTPRNNSCYYLLGLHKEYIYFKVLDCELPVNKTETGSILLEPAEPFQEIVL